ncbi:MAG TPA: hypothetical protein ENI23_17345 [bacterium]|nr:hypothetical protein [bacterium]
MGFLTEKTKEHGLRLKTELIVFVFGFIMLGITAYLLGFPSAWFGGEPTAWGLFLLQTKNNAHKLILMSEAIVFIHFSRKAIFHKTDLTDMLHGTNGGKNVPVGVRQVAVLGTYLYYGLGILAFALMM